MKSMMVLCCSWYGINSIISHDASFISSDLSFSCGVKGEHTPYKESYSLKWPVFREMPEGVSTSTGTCVCVCVCVCMTWKYYCPIVKRAI